MNREYREAVRVMDRVIDILEKDQNASKEELLEGARRYKESVERVTERRSVKGLAIISIVISTLALLGVIVQLCQ